MEKWELFLRGFAKTVEEFITGMVEKGSEESEEIEVPKATPKVIKKRMIPRRDLGE